LIYGANTGLGLPQPKNPCANCIAKPVDVVTGDVWSSHSDIRLAGPFGLKFERWYRTSQSYETNPINDLGPGWQDNYDARLDLTNVAEGSVNFTDDASHVVYFGGVAIGSPAYDQIDGDTLVQNSDGTFSVTTRNGLIYNFDVNGFLSSMVDRNGNTQTLTRSTTSPYNIIMVTDTLGRSLNFSYDSLNRITSVVSSPTGESVSFSYVAQTNCSAGNLCVVTAVDNTTWKYQYFDYYNSVNGGTYHPLKSVTDPNGHIVEQDTYNLSYNGIWQAATQSSDAGQNSLTFAYNPDTATTTVTDGNGNTTTYEVDNYVNVITAVLGPMCHCGGAEAVYDYYDTFGRILQRDYYDPHGSGIGKNWFWTYGDDVIFNNQYVQTAYPEPTTIQTPSFQTITLAYFQPEGPPGLGNPLQDLVQTATTDSIDTPGKNSVTTYVYDTAGRMKTRTTVAYSNHVSTTMAMQYTWDSKGRPLTESGPRATTPAQVTTYSYYGDTLADKLRAGQLKTLADPVGNVLTFGSNNAYYNIYGEALSTVDPNGVITKSTFDKLGRLLASAVQATVGGVTNPTTKTTYDAFGNSTLETEPAGNSNQFIYDTNNRVVARILVDKNSVKHESRQYAYDNMGRTSAIQVCSVPTYPCPSQDITQLVSYKYDAFDRLIETDEPATPGNSGSVIKVAYNGLGSVASRQDENHTTPNITFSYDGYDRLQSESDLLTGAPGSADVVDYGYNDRDEKTTISDAHYATSSTYKTTTLSYDDFGRRILSQSPTTGTTTYSYDAASDIAQIVDANGATRTFTYDPTDRELSETAVRGSTTEIVNLTYDTATYGRGRIATMTDNGTHVSTYQYDQRGQVTNVAQTDGGTQYQTKYAYDANSNTASIQYPSTMTVSYGYDYADRQVSATNGTTIFVSAATYKPFGPITSISYGNSIHPTTQTLTYDARYRPESNMLTASTGTLATYTYLEDPVGNFTQVHDALNSAYNRDFAFDDMNRLTTANSGSSLWGSGSYSYDGIGNISQFQLGVAHTATFTYAPNSSILTNVVENSQPSAVVIDAAGNETGIGSTTNVYSPRNLMSSSGAYTYSYDGTRTRFEIVAPGGARYYFYGQNHHLLSETGIGSTAIAHEFVYLGDRPVAQVDGSTVSWTFTDQLGVPLAQTNGAASITWRAEYEPYGLVFALRGGDIHQPLRYPGQESEQFDTGINGATTRSYNDQRWYQPSWGRYTQSDPIGLLGGAYAYSYAVDNPLGNIDPLGLLTCPPFGAVGARLVIDDINTMLQHHIDWSDGTAAPVTVYSTLLWFKGVVQTNGDEDFKNQPGLNPTASPAIYHDWDVMGNYNYGAVALALGVPWRFALRAAHSGREQDPNNADMGDPGTIVPPNDLAQGAANAGTSPYFDKRADQQEIKEGFEFYKEWRANPKYVECICK
jgi:RHS repeat-associated protein